MSTARRRRRRRSSPRVVVGQDITAPPQVARSSSIRIRTEEAATVARWFGLGARPRRRKRLADAPPAEASGAPAKPIGTAPANPVGTAPAGASAPAEVIARVALAPGSVTLITGPSGAGKTSLLRELYRKQQHDTSVVDATGVSPSCTWIDINAIVPAPDVPIVNGFGDTDLLEVLKLLGRVGLGEAWTYLRTPDELSEGQRFRLRLALALHEATVAIDELSAVQEDHDSCDRARESSVETLQAASEEADRARHHERRPDDDDDDHGVDNDLDNIKDNDHSDKDIVTVNHDSTKGRDQSARARPRANTRSAPPRAVLVCDEFAAVLDRLTAMVVARCLRRAIDAHPTLAAVVATSHEDLLAALRPDELVRCDFGKIEVSRRRDGDRLASSGGA